VPIAISRTAAKTSSSMYARRGGLYRPRNIFVYKPFNNLQLNIGITHLVLMHDITKFLL
jgi:hypothetical protein